MQQVGSYVTNDPDKLTPFETNSPEDIERTERWPVTNGVSPSVPTDAQNIFPPKQPELPSPSPQPPEQNTS
jgi:hypothetical protein